MSIKDNLHHIEKELPPMVRLVAVSKTKPVEAIEEAYAAGQRVFGENKAQEMALKYEQLPRDIEWHFIGHLQTNKVKYIAPFVSLIHSVDSLKVLKEINKQAGKNKRVIDCLLQFHIAEEATKFGLNMEEAEEIIGVKDDFANVKLVGVMGMATFTPDKAQVRREFKQLHSYFEILKKKFFVDDELFREVSMGMSGDYSIAVEEGSTLVRIGTLIFGKRG
ncbi:MAG: YggS family pyridoxal phosphate-dependent enzyme [Bacteroidetes bacterium]|nr:MAG: YggS family pyridoxal phosphate-dependent enzyme [Bacteroidota bacterium]